MLSDKQLKLMAHEARFKFYRGTMYTVSYCNFDEEEGYNAVSEFLGCAETLFGNYYFIFFDHERKYYYRCNIEFKPFHRLEAISINIVVDCRSETISGLYITDKNTLILDTPLMTERGR